MNTATNTFNPELFGRVNEIRITMKDDKKLDFVALVNSSPDYILNDEIIEAVNHAHNDWLEVGDTDIDIIMSTKDCLPFAGFSDLHDENIINGKREYRLGLINDGYGDLYGMTSDMIRNASVMLNNDKVYGPLGIEEVLFFIEGS